LIFPGCFGRVATGRIGGDHLAEVALDDAASATAFVGRIAEISTRTGVHVTNATSMNFEGSGNITWRQEVGGSSIEASKIAGHSTVRMADEYTKIQLTRQEELTRRIQERLASVGEKQSAAVQ